MNPITIGIDTGAAGGVAIGTCASDLVLFSLMPERVAARKKAGVNVVSVTALRDALSPFDLRGAVAFVELPFTAAQTGTSLAGQTGRTLGRIEATLLVLGARVEIVDPKAWHQHHGIIVGATRGEGGAKRYKAGKEASLAVAERLFPLLYFRPQPRRTKGGALYAKQPKPFYDLADAALIWSYGHALLGRPLV